LRSIRRHSASRRDRASQVCDIRQVCAFEKPRRRADEEGPAAMKLARATAAVIDQTENKEKPRRASEIGRKTILFAAATRICRRDSTSTGGENLAWKNSCFRKS
jgi:hypothetical protein